MAIFEAIGTNLRRCETTVVELDGSCRACGAGQGQPCNFQIPMTRRATMARRQRSAQLERLQITRLDGAPVRFTADNFPSWEDAAWKG
jgi:hypothetical protein